MYSGIIRHRNIYSLNIFNGLSGDIKFHLHSDLFMPPLFTYNDTRFSNCYFVNKFGIFVLPRSSIFKLNKIKSIYNLFQKKAFNKNFTSFNDKIQAFLNVFTLNHIYIYFVAFDNLKYNAKNIEYHTNLSKDTIIIFQTLNSTLPYPS
jgi:hypothetical protein